MNTVLPFFLILYLFYVKFNRGHRKRRERRFVFSLTALTASTHCQQHALSALALAHLSPSPPPVLTSFTICDFHHCLFASAALLPPVHLLAIFSPPHRRLRFPHVKRPIRPRTPQGPLLPLQELSPFSLDLFRSSDHRGGVRLPAAVSDPHSVGRVHPTARVVFERHVLGQDVAHLREKEKGRTGKERMTEQRKGRTG